MIATLTAISAAIQDILTNVPLVIVALGDLDTFLATL